MVDDLAVLLVPGRVEVGVAAQRQAHRLRVDQQRRDTQPRELPSRPERLDELHRAGDVGGQPLGDVDVGVDGTHHRLGGDLAHPLDGNAAFPTTLRAARRSESVASRPRVLETGGVVDDPALRGFLPGCFPRRPGPFEDPRGLDVGAGDGALRPGPRDLPEIDPEVARIFAHRRFGPRGLRIGGQHQHRLGGRITRLRQRIADGSGDDPARGIHVVGTPRRLTGGVALPQRLTGGLRIPAGSVPAAAPRPGGFVARPVADEGRGLLPATLDAVLDLDDGGADLHRDPLRHQQRRHGPGIGRGQFHQRLGGLDLDEHVVDLDFLPDGDPPGDDLGFGETLTGIRKKELAFHHHSLSPRLTRPGNGRGRRGCGPPTAGTRPPGATAGRGCRSR